MKIDIKRLDTSIMIKNRKINMIKNFANFINENYTLTIEDDMDGFDVKLADWVEQFDVSDIWEKYKEKHIGEKEFIKEYEQTLAQKKEKLNKIDESCWMDLSKLFSKKEKTFQSYLTQIYDWADKYGIKIISETK